MSKRRLVQEVGTARDTGHRLSTLEPSEFRPAKGRPASFVFIDTEARFQELIGFGGAFTESAATTLDRMTAGLRAEVLRAYFSTGKGHGYTVCRTHINSCDFSTGHYAYAETEGDVELEHFSIERDRQSLIPMIRDAMDIAGGRLRLFASPWSPPAWMKTNGRMDQGGKLRPEYREAWARYYVRYVQEYAQEGIPIWGLTVQNEPEAAQRWESCLYTADEERDFVKNFLGPVLRRSGLGDLKLMIWDHNRDGMYERAKAVFDDREASQYVWGIGFHWYERNAFENVRLVHDAYPDKRLVFTEGCQEHGPQIGSWALGERYARSIIQDLNHWTVGWVDWNLVLDQNGGPNHAGNLCSAPILVNTDLQEVLYQSSYFYLGHFSRFIRPGAHRVACGSSQESLESTAFLNSDGTVAVVVMNRTDEPIEFVLRTKGLQAETAIPAHGIKTFVFERELTL